MASRNLNTIILSDPRSFSGQTQPSDDYIKRGADLLETEGTTTTIALSDPSWREELRSALPSADLLLVSPWRSPDILIDGAMLDSAPRLKAIGGTFDNRFTTFVSIDELTERGIVLVDTSRSMTPTVAEFALAQTLNLLRDIPSAVALMRAGGWKRSSWDSFGHVYGDLAGKKIGLAGYGSINRRYHELISGFGCPTAVYDPILDKSGAEQLGLTYTDSLEELAAASEIFVVGIPPLKSSLRAIDKTVFDALPVGSLFVLVSRMAVVDEPALWDAVDNRRLRAAIDVFSTEPVPPDAPFRFHPNVLPTPHIAGEASYCHERCFYDACLGCLAVIKGQPRRFEATRIDATMYMGVAQNPKPQ
ncbi:NAD(P)-dependent oxidoreductase [Rhodococcus sp. NPDC059968]|uniref:NAD(P)-dependent oxidoreductase n=1 Tax=Rhodococcus sp. NPDC059968 TaxID=3347017 RepID=UPI003671248F